MKKLISKLKEVPDLESKHPWGPVSQNINQNMLNDNVNTFNHYGLSTQQAPNYSHLNTFIGKKFNIGRFIVVIEEIIAEGGFGIVFKVRSQNDHVFALKRLCVNNRADLKVCKREITIMSSLTHKNILSLIDSQINEQSSEIFEVLMLLAYCPKNVAQLMQGKQKRHQHLPENVVIKILCDIIEAVARLHYCQTPVIHRDLKVENILIDERNNYVLCDFGSATVRQIIPIEYGITKTEEEILKYTTLAYRSPEMVQLGNHLIDCKSDIWALGCLLYYLCFFTLPFADKVLAIQSGKFNIPKTDITYSDKILKLIKYMLTVNPVNRPSIYQVSVLAFSIANKKSPIQNLDKEKVPHWDDLELPNNTQISKKAVSNMKNQQSGTLSNENDLKIPSVSNTSIRSRSLVNQTKSVETSINPRIRPRAHKPPLSKSESADNSLDNATDKAPHNISQSNSFNICLSNSKSSTPKTTSGINCNSPVENREAEVENTVVSDLPETQAESPMTNNLTVERVDNQRIRFGHRRMVSETSSKPVVEENIKSGKSLFNLTAEKFNDLSLPGSEMNLSNNLQSVTITLSDGEVDNDALFGEEFDRIRHQSEASSGE